MFTESKERGKKGVVCFAFGWGAWPGGGLCLMTFYPFKNFNPFTKIIYK